MIPAKHGTASRIARRRLVLLAMWVCAAAWHAHALNVVVIVVDDLRDVRDFGNQVSTPNLDRLAARSVVFNNAYCQNPMCNPSRISFLSGLRSAKTGNYDNLIPAPENLPGWNWLPTCLRTAGWHTTLVGKVFHAPHSTTWIPQSSYDRLFHIKASDYGVPILSSKTFPNIPFLRAIKTDGGHLRLADGQIATIAANQVNLLEAGSRPYAIFAGFHKPHTPLRAPKEYFDLYDPSSIVFPDEPPLDAQNYQPGVWFEDVNVPPTPADRREALQAYFACVSYMDSQLGRILDALDANDSWSDTIVLFFSDHGFHLGEHGGLAWGKAWNTEQSTRCPLMIAAPGIEPGECNSVVELVDIYPTLLDLLEVPVEEPIDGTSLVPVLHDPQATVKPAAFSEYRNNARHAGVSIRTQTRRYTKFRHAMLGSVLIDHTNDPFEFRNLSTTEPYSRELALLEELLPPDLQLRQRVELLTPTPDRDLDGLPDVFELRWGSNPRVSDFDSSLGWPHMDGNGDGFANILHYAFRVPLTSRIPSSHAHLHPRVGTSGSFPGHAFVFELPTEPVRSIRVSIEESSDLRGWTVVGYKSGKAGWSWNRDTKVDLSSSAVPGYQTISVELPGPSTTRGLYYRLTAEFE